MLFAIYARFHAADNSRLVARQIEGCVRHVLGSTQAHHGGGCCYSLWAPPIASYIGACVAIHHADSVRRSASGARSTVDEPTDVVAVGGDETHALIPRERPRLVVVWSGLTPPGSGSPARRRRRSLVVLWTDSTPTTDLSKGIRRPLPERCRMG